MDSISEKPVTTSNERGTSTRQTGVLMVVAISVLIGLLYVPLLYWLGRMTLHTQQLVNGAFLVLMALVICVRDAAGKLRLQPQFSNLGIGLLALGFFYLWLAGRSRYWALPLVLLSFCLSFAGIMSFLFGRMGVKPFLPMLGAFFVFGVLVGLFPTLDWPLRAMAAQYAGGLLAWLGVPVKLVLAAGQPAKLILGVNGQDFEVATECNGFGLLTSSLIVATILAFHYQMRGDSQAGVAGAGGADRHRLQFPANHEHLRGGAADEVAVWLRARDAGIDFLLHRTRLNLEDRRLAREWRC